MASVDCAREKLSDPLGIDTGPAAQPVASDEGRSVSEKAAFAWPTDPQGINVGFGLLKMTASDMAKLGQVFLDGGRWRGQQVVSTGCASGQPSRAYRRGAGRPLRIPVVDRHADDHAAYAAIGVGGQIVEVVPDLKLVVTAYTIISDQTVFDATTFELLTSTVIASALA